MASLDGPKHLGLGVRTQVVRQVGMEGDEVWESLRQRHWGTCALAAKHEDTWDSQPEAAMCWWSMGEDTACGQVSSSWAAASENMHQFQSTVRP